MAKQSAARQSYRFTGPVTPLIQADGRERMLFPGTSYTDLPADHPIVLNLIARKLLIPEMGEAAAIEVGPIDLSEGA